MLKVSASFHHPASRIVSELVTDREAREYIQRVLAYQKSANEDDHQRLSDRDIRRMICASIQAEQPHLSRAAIERFLERRWTAAMKPYAGVLPVRSKAPTGRDVYRRERKQMVKRGKEGRR